MIKRRIVTHRRKQRTNPDEDITEDTSMSTNITLQMQYFLSQLGAFGLVQDLHFMVLSCLVWINIVMYCKYIVVYSFIVPLWNNVLYRVCNLCRVLMCCWNVSLCGCCFILFNVWRENATCLFLSCNIGNIRDLVASLTVRGYNRTVGFQCNKTIANKWRDDFFQDIPSFHFFRGLQHVRSQRFSFEL